MDLTALLLRIAARHPHVLVVAVPGQVGVRLAVEAALVRRGWPPAAAPADADIVVVAGAPGPQLQEVVEQVWQLVPAPRARTLVAEPADADRELDRAARSLADRHRQSAPTRAGAGPAPGADDQHPDQRPDQDHGAHGGHDGDHGGHGGHHGHDMGAPAGLPMPGLGADRDGLTLDRLHVALGPVLPDWPAGLVVRVTLQGDVVQEATVEVLDADAVHVPGWDGHVAVRRLDGLARFLGVAGWPDAAVRARRLRDALLVGSAPGEIASPAVALVRWLRRSRTLWWLIRGIPAGTTDVAGLLDEQFAAVEAMFASPDAAPRPRPAVAALPGLLDGAELASARLIVAAVDPETEQVPTQDEAGHG